jgi:hypothetical protein
MSIVPRCAREEPSVAKAKPIAEGNPAADMESGTNPCIASPDEALRPEFCGRSPLSKWVYCLHCQAAKGCVRCKTNLRDATSRNRSQKSREFIADESLVSVFPWKCNTSLKSGTPAGFCTSHRQTNAPCILKKQAVRAQFLLVLGTFQRYLEAMGHLFTCLPHPVLSLHTSHASFPA